MNSTTTQPSGLQFESSVKKIREKTDDPVDSTDELGGLLERVRRHAEAPLRENQKWDKPSDRSAPNPEYESLMDFAQMSSSELEAIENDIAMLDKIGEEANREAYSSMLGITEGSNPRRALESDERVVDKLRHEALEAGHDEAVADNINESISNNIESLEENVEDTVEDLNQSLAPYAEDFEGYVEEMAGLARDEYGAMAQLTDYLQDLDQIDTESELGEMTVDYLMNETADILAVQTQNVSEIYSEIVKATNSTKRLRDNIDSDIADQHNINIERLEESIAYAEETLGNMAGDYDDFSERAEAMVEENTRNIDSFDLSAIERWDSIGESEKA
ncbi:MAG: hypothetical protein R6V35_02405 [Candidatus Nanohaloarchaea archaeon]